MAPSIYDEDGDYLAFSTDATAGDVRKVGAGADDGRKHAYSDMSIWDIHRTQLPLLSLTAPDVFKDVLRSLQAMMAEGTGDVPRWPLLNIYTNCMIGAHAFVSMAEAVLKGQADGLDTHALYASMRRAATTPRANGGRIAVNNWTDLGYISVEAWEQGASATLAYAFDDSAIATVAASVGDHANAAVFRNRSTAAYKHLWSPKHQLLCILGFGLIATDFHGLLSFITTAPSCSAAC